MEMKTRPVLTINQVFDIICKYQECKNWLVAFTSTLPKRKGAQQIQQDQEEKDEESKSEVKTQTTTSS